MKPNLKLKTSLIVVFIFLFLGNAFSQNRIIYVDAANGNNNRSYDQNTQGGWGQAWKDLVHALYWARANDEIWLNAGTYYPVQAGELGKANADRNKSFYTHSNVKIYGGFSIANGATTMATRNAATYITTLSADIQQDGNVTNNSYSLIRTYLNNGFSVLDGVTLTSTYVDHRDYAVYGGAMNLNGVSPTISNCRFTDNRATQGGAVFCDKANPTFNSCTFSGNSTIYGNGYFSTNIFARGGAVYNAGSSPTFNSCIFTGNYASAEGLAYDGNGTGGAVCNDQKLGASSPRFNSCEFKGNYATGSMNSAIYSDGGSAYYNGCLFQNNSGIGVYTARATDVFVASAFIGNGKGGIRIEQGSTKLYNCAILNNSGIEGGGIALIDTKKPYPVISNCLITGNVASTMGGGIYNYYSTAIINNCTIAGNTATLGGGVYNIGCGYEKFISNIYYDTPSSYQNCLISGNKTTLIANRDTIKANFYTDPVPYQSTYTYLYYNHRSVVSNCLLGTTDINTVKNTDEPVSSIPTPNPLRVAMDGGGNIFNVNPKFINAAAGNYAVDNCSRAIDAGRNEFIPPGSPTAGLDQNNLTRIINGKVDIGCYEKQDAAPANVTNLYQYICEGGSAVINGQSQTQAGTYTKVYTAKNGCDSVINTILVVNPLPKGVVVASDNCGSTGTLEIRPTVGRAPFSVTLNGTTISNIASGGSAKFTALAAGTYPYTITDSPVNGASCGGTGTAELRTNMVSGNTIYVDANATGNNTGKNFTNAFTNLQQALTLAKCAGVTQIFVAQGTYYPSRDVTGALVDTRFATFRMLNGLSIYGGFNVATGDTTLAKRNWKAYPTVLSGDIQKDGNIANNVYNVVNNWGNGLNNTAMLDGFTIYGAYNDYNDGGNITYGGGMVNNGSSPTIKNCTFNNNHANAVTDAFGGAMYNINCAPVISNCIFTNNDVSGTNIAFGGAVYNDTSSPTFTACVFDNNRTLNAVNLNGGAISSANGSPVTIANCLFTSNNVGAVSTFANNTNIINSTFYTNAASNGLGGAFQSYNSTPAITNCIMYGNSNGNIVNSNSTPVIKNSLIGNSGGSTAWNTAYGTDGGGNKDINPKFTASFGLSACSPAKDAGTNIGVATTDLGGNPRTINTTTDMGCYEFQTDLSTYYSTIYVDANATGLNNGTSWANAFTDLSDALKLVNCVPVYTIYVSKGTYYPSLNSSDGLAENYQAPTFTLRYGVSVYGGFSVADGITTIEARNPALYPTILSGDANKDGILTNNAKAVVTVPYGVEYALLDGFTIQDGYNNSTGAGSGIYMDNAKATFQNCTISSNTVATASGYGAGAYCYYSTPVFTKCKFYGNTVQGTTQAYGGGVYNIGSTSSFSDCEFVGNSIDAGNASYGAAMNNENSPVTVRRCRFVRNIASGRNLVAGGIYTHGVNGISIDNSLFDNNTGGALCSDGTNIAIINSTIVNNFNPNVDYTGGILNISSNATVTNCIFYGNSNASVSNVTSTTVIKNSLLQGSGGSTAWNTAFGTNDGGNIDADPLFKSGYQLSPCSPAINTGTNTLTGPLDFNSNNRILGGTVDMGCFESTTDLSLYGGGIIYVNATATGSNNGSSWSNAFTSLQSALDIAQCAGVTQIYVSKGTYAPSANMSNTPTSGQDATFKMQKNLAIIGGFSVADGVTTIGARNISLYPAILSGEIQKDGNPSNNVYNVINNYNTGVDSTAVLDGFTITGAMNNLTGLGGGIINANTSPKFLNCTISDNFVGGTYTATGAGMYNLNASPIIRNCLFTANRASGIDNAFGAGLSNDNSSPKIERCIFRDNIVSAPNPAGGAIYSSNGSGGAISNSLFSGNTGTAICADASVFTLYNVTIAGNSGTSSRAGGLLLIANSNFNILNSIVYGNADGNITNLSSVPTFYYCNVGGSGGSSWNTTYGTSGGGNKDVDPVFTSDYHLQASSPLINAGDNASAYGNIDLGGENRKKNVTDLGAYEFQGENIISVAAISNIIVNKGTAVASVGLPTAVNVTLSNSSTVTANVSWNTSSYNANVAADYPLTGTIALSNGGIFSNTNHLTAAVVVQVIEGTLPVSLSAYHAKQEGNAARLDWVTTAERDHKTFIISRAIDGVSFTEIGRVNGAGNANTTNAYYLYDRKPLNGTNYYKLVQIDNNGKVQELGVRSVTFDFQTNTLNIYPNPTTNQITINWNKGIVNSLKLIDLSGNVILTIKPKKMATSVIIPLANYPVGTYLIRIEGNNGVEIRKIVKL